MFEMVEKIWSEVGGDSWYCSIFEEMLDAMLEAYDQSLNLMLKMSDDIGIMADRIDKFGDRILDIADKILVMADKINYMGDNITSVIVKGL